MDTLYLSHLKVNHFRNIERLELIPNRRFNVISGQNGSGKTNLLEAIYFFGALRSFRTAFRSEIVRHEQPLSKLSGLFEGAAAGLLCEIELGQKTRKIRSSGKEVTSTSSHFSELPMVLFHPANMSLVQGGPSERRRFMDRALYQAEPSYPELRSDYARALQSRNKLLKNPHVGLELILPYDDQLAGIGSELVRMRGHFIEQAKSRFEDAFFRTSKGLSGSIAYKPDVQGDKSELLAALSEAFEKDSRRGFTSRGPHADDLTIEVSGLPAKRFASQGQQRMVVLSLKVAETLALHEATGRVPILLMDDISSELDRIRNREFFDFLRTVGGQVFITTTHLDHVILEGDRSDFFIEQGIVLEKSE